MADDSERALKLYEFAASDETSQFDRYQKAIAFHFGIVTAILAGTVAGVFRASESHHFYFLVTGPVLTLIAAKIGREATTRLYMGWLERVTVRAKLEQQLALTRQQPPVPGGYWLDEAFVPARNLRARSESRSSEEFVNQWVHAGYNSWVRRLFLWVGLLGVAVFVGLIAMARVI